MNTIATNSAADHASFISLPRYPLSYVLSYLSECDGASTLLTSKLWSRRVLPLFVLRRPPSSSAALTVRQSSETKCERDAGNGDNTRRIPKTRHMFVVCPVQDPETLLARLNSRRLCKRLVRLYRIKEYDVTSTDAYRVGMTTDELARWEWHGKGDADSNNIGSERFLSWRWPADLELLMWRHELVPSQTTAMNPASFPFNNGSSNGRNSGTIVLASYPRSGNTLLRTLLERTTLCVTGSDTRPDRTLSKALAMQHNLVGEGIVRSTTPADDNILSRPSVGVVKTHWPERRGCLPYNCNRVILLVRNPYDAIDSYWNLCVTNTHTDTVVDEIYTQYADKFRGLALSEMKTWVKFHSWWLNECKERGLDVCLVRYEDLVTDVGRTFRDVMRFVLGTRDIDAFWEGRIRHALNEGKGGEQCTTRLGSYRPRNESGQGSAQKEGSINNTSGGGASNGHGVPPSIGKSLRRRRYSDEMLLRMHDTAASMPSSGDEDVSLLKQFGYDLYEQDFSNNFASGGTKLAGNGKTMQTDSIRNGASSSSSIRVNVGPEIRPSNDAFGRAMTTWRKKQTAGDTEPFPTVQR